MSKISCEEVLKEVELLLDGELDPSRAAELRHHLSDCFPCLERAEFQQKLKQIIRSKVRCEAPAHLTVKIREVIRGEVRVKRPQEGPPPQV